MEFLRKIMYLLFESIVGIGFIAVGIYNYNANIDEVNEKTITIEATISNIEEEEHYRKGEREYYYRLYVNYTYDNEIYENKEINLSSNFKRIGDKIKVKVNPENPGNPIYIEQQLLSIIVIVIGIILLGVGIKNSMLMW